MVYDMMGYYGNGMWFFGFVTWLLIVAALVLLIIFLSKQIQNPRRR